MSIEATPSSAASATPVPQPSVDPNPVGTLRYTVERQRPKLEVATEQGTEEIQLSAYGMPVDVRSLPMVIGLPSGSWARERAD